MRKNDFHRDFPEIFLSRKYSRRLSTFYYASAYYKNSRKLSEKFEKFKYDETDSLMLQATKKTCLSPKYIFSEDKKFIRGYL